MFVFGPHFLEVLVIMLTYAAGVTTAVAFIATAVVYFDGRAIETNAESTPNRMEPEQDLDHVEEALSIANS